MKFNIELTDIGVLASVERVHGQSKSDQNCNVTLKDIKYSMHIPYADYATPTGILRAIYNYIESLIATTSDIKHQPTKTWAKEAAKFVDEFYTEITQGINATVQK